MTLDDLTRLKEKRSSDRAALDQLLDEELVGTLATVTTDGRHTLMLVLAVGSGVGEGEFVNRAQAMSALTGNPLSGEASATVRIIPDPALDCTDVIGKVFDDANRNGLQDEGERGIPQVRLATARGLVATTDPFGRFHITCAITPHEDRGTNFVLKLDDRTLPSGYRSSTELMQVKRATRGKALEFNFGASIHRVIGLDLADPVFEPNSTQMRELWVPRRELLMNELRAAPAVLRLSYLADLEDPQLVDARLKTLRKRIEEAWQATEGGPSYELAIDEGADALECDVRLTADSHLVCVHDRRVNRTSNGRGIVSTVRNNEECAA